MMVNNPLNPHHYKLGIFDKENREIEVVDILEQVLGRDEFLGSLKADIIEYILRADRKGGLEDYKKAGVKLNLLIKLLDAARLMHDEGGW